MDAPATPLALAATPELTVVIPTLNEAGNVEPLILGLEAALAGLGWSAIVVDDDSPDGTYEVLRRLAAARPRLRPVRRVGRRGLASACIEGMRLAESPAIAVLDGDLQHDERLLPAMLARLRTEQLDLVIASRMAAGGSLGPLPPLRRLASRAGNRLTRQLCKVPVQDAMSGYFMLTRALFEQVLPALSGRGTKILLDILTACSQPPRLAEMPLRFRDRRHGASKLDAQVLWAFARLLAEKRLGRARAGLPRQRSLPA
jgi:dolichol-phosphate mannosyltransferase